MEKYVYGVEGRSIIFGKEGTEVMELADNVMIKYIKIGQDAEIGIRDGQVNFVKAVKAEGSVGSQENSPQILSPPRTQSPLPEQKTYMSIREEQEAAKQESIVRQCCLKVAGRLAESDKIDIERVMYYAGLYRDWVFNEKTKGGSE